MIEEIGFEIAVELKSKKESLVMSFPPGVLFSLVAAMQAAKERPDLPDSVEANADKFIQSAIAYFADCPTILQVINEKTEGKPAVN